LVNGNEVTIIDFEQGINGGDWYTDINKLLNPQTGSVPDTERRYRYVAPLTMIQKQEFIRAYIVEREQNGWKTPVFLSEFVNTGERSVLEKRSKLCAVENMLSVLTLRYLSNWNFYHDVETNRRGTHYLVEFIQNKFPVNDSDFSN